MRQIQTIQPVKKNNAEYSEKRLVAKNLSKTYKKTKVLNNVSIDLDIGEVVGLLGPNGAGKTTCFYIIAGLIKPDDGKVNIGKINITGFPVYERARIGLGYLPQL